MLCLTVVENWKPRPTPETETNNTIPFFDMLVTRDWDGYLSTSVYGQPTDTDQYLHVAYSHHPQSVKRGTVKHLYDRSKHLITKPSVISKEKKHFSTVLVSNGYPFSFMKNNTKTKKQTATKEPAPRITSTVVLPYVEFGFIDQDPHWYTHRVKEAIHIRLHPDNINRDNGIEIPEAWMPMIKQHRS